MSDFWAVIYQILSRPAITLGLVSSVTPTHAFSHQPVLRHSLANPLTSLHLSLEACLTEAIKKHPQLVPHLQEALASTKYVNQLLFTHQHHSLNLQATITEVVTRLHQPRRGYNVHLVDLSDKPLISKGNHILLQEALSCAIQNSWEAYPRGLHKQVIITLYQRRRQAIIQITDFGQGMTWLTKRLVVTRGLSLKATHRGLGTKFIKDVIEGSCGGQVVINSYWGIGTTHSWVLPLKR